MNIIVNLYLEEEKIGTINHQYLVNDEANSGRRICEGSMLILNDFRFRVKSVIVHQDELDVELIEDSLVLSSEG